MLITAELGLRVIFIAAWSAFITSLTWVRFETRGRPRAKAGGRSNRKRALALALFAPLWFTGLVLYAVHPSSIALLSIPLPVWFRYALVALIAPSIAFVIWSNKTLGKNWVHALDAATFLERKDQVLVTNGPYRYVRNPMYIGVALVILGQACFFRSVHVLGYAVLMLITAHLFVVFYEEPTLERQFGKSYEEYRRTVPRWLPRL